MSNKNSRTLLATLISLILTPGVIHAADTTGPQAEPSVNEVEIGLGNIENDSYRFGRFNGMTDEGTYIIGNIKAKSFSEGAGFWKLRGTNLGLDSRYLRFDAGVQGTQQFFIEYDKTPDYENDTATTPFINPGSTHLLLPDGYGFPPPPPPPPAIPDPTDDKKLNSYVNNVYAPLLDPRLEELLDAHLLPFDQKTERERIGLGAKLHLKSRWQLRGSMSHETLEGTDWIGAAMGSSTINNIFKWTNGALLPEPIDYETDKIDAALTYHGKQTQFELAYKGSMFYNNDSSLSWTDPLPNYDPYGEHLRPGRISLEPDNQMHQLSTVLGHMFTPTTRLTALASVSLLTQDDAFLPYSVSDTVDADNDGNPVYPDQQDNSLDALPQESLDGKVWLYRGQLKLTTRPSRQLRLSALYNYDERDNTTSSNTYYYTLADNIMGDGKGEAEPPINPRTNDPLSYRKQKLDLAANYRFNSKMSLRGGYQYNHNQRDHDDDQVKTTREHIVSAKFKVRPTSQLNLDLYGETGKRTGSTYYTRAHENPDLRIAYLADLDRDKIGASVNYMPNYRLNLGLTAEYLKDDYTESEIGLTESKQKSGLVNLNYHITDNIHAHAYYNYEEFQSNNANENKEIEKGTFDQWEADLKDSSNSFGLGFTIDKLANKWDAGLDWVYTRSKGQIDMTGYQASIHKVTGEFLDADGNVISEGIFEPLETQEFPDVKSDLHSLELWARYRYSDNIAYKLSYWYEHYSTEDWATDGTIESPD
nr:MtrB/PioB family decaheme-associated outer membrane protein [Gammaproteobacteria bacterium]